ncbi:MAG: glucan biosynthesis protein C [Bradymonadia bacterium]|jgi:glucan biosynthesis protein C
MSERPAFDRPADGPAQRIYALDHVRAFALLLGVVYHSAHAWSARLHVPWIVEAQDGSWGIAAFEQISHLFRMPLFYALAGFFAALVIARRGVVAFISNRLARIVLPFMIGLPILALVFVSILRDAPADLSPMTRALHAPPIADAPREPFQVFHLWFLVYLTWFSGLAVLAHRAPQGVRRIVSRLLPRVLNTRSTLLWLPLILVPAIASQPMPAQSPTALAPALWPFGYFGVFFALGYALYHHPSALDRLQRGLTGLIPACLVGAPLFVWGIATDAHLSSQGRLLMIGLHVYLSMYMTIVIWMLARRWLDSPLPWVRYVSDASYWIYLAHLPVVLWLQVKLAAVDWHPWLEFALCVGATFAITLGSYAIAVRHTPIGWMLNGRRAK